MADWASSELSTVGRTITSAAPVAVVEFDSTGVVLRCDGEMEPVSEQTCAGQRFEVLLSGWPAMRQHVRRALEGESFTALDQYRQKFYESWLSARAEEGQIVGVQWVLIDVTTRERRREDRPAATADLEREFADAMEQLEAVDRRVQTETKLRKRAEDTARHCEERVRAVVDAAPDALVMVSETGQVIDWNLRADELFGWSREEIIGKPMVQTLFAARFHAALREGLDSYVANRNSPILNQRLEMTALTKDKNEKPVELTIAPLEVGRSVTFAVFMRDITERLEAGQALRESEQRTRLIINSAFDAIVTIDAQGMILDWNPQAQAIFGWELPQVKGKSFCELLVAGEDRDRACEIFDDAEREIDLCEQRQRIELHGLRRDRQKFIAEIGLCAFNRGQERIVSAFIRDVTSRRRLEQALRDSNARLEALVEDAPMAIVMFDDRDRVTGWNQAAERLFGASGSDVIGRELPNVPDEDTEYQEILKKVKAGEAVYDVRAWRLHQNGELVAVRLWAAPLLNENGRVTGRIERLMAANG